MVFLYTVFAFDELVEEEDDEEEEDDPDADADGDGDDEEKGDEGVKIDDIAGVVEELKKLKLAYKPVAMSGRKNARDLMEGFNEVQNQKKGDAKDYPRNHRLCGLMDMRPLKVLKRPKDEEIGDNNALIFESANSCNEVKTSSNSAMGYFNRAKTCIIPDAADAEGAKMEALSSGPHFTVCKRQRALMIMINS